MTNAILIAPNTAPQTITHDLTLEALQASVGGGYIDVAFTVPSPRPGRAITGYVDDEGLLNGLPLTAFRVSGEHRAPLVGPIIVVGLDRANGETVPLTKVEIDYFLSRTLVADLVSLNDGTVAQTVTVIDFALFARTN